MIETIFSLSAVTIGLALLVDILVGDPRWLPHPVVGIGKMIYFLERKWYPKSLLQRRVIYVRGMAVSIIVVVLTFFLTAIVLLGAHVLLHETAVKFLAIILLGIALASRSLAESALEIKNLLQQGDIEQARLKLSYIVGRDTAHLDEGEIVRATIETVAENIVDGIVSPLFYALLAGVPGAYAYKAVNTLDSMIGYRNDRYLWFGRFAAKLDDAANYIPARVTGFFMVVAGVMLGHSFERMVKTLMKDASKHPSPNSGIPEAVMAGALGIQLGGLNYYGNVPSWRATMGQPIIPMKPHHIIEAIKVMGVTTLLFGLAGASILLWLGKWY